MPQGIVRLLDLSLNVNFPECRALGLLEESAGLAGEQYDAVGALVEQFSPAFVVADELCSIGVGFKSKLLCDESQLHVWLVSVIMLDYCRIAGNRDGLRSADIRQRCQTLSYDEHIHEICAHVRRVEV